MKARTINDIFDKEIGHKKFAKFIKLAQADNHVIGRIREGYEKFTFNFDGYPTEFSKATKDVKEIYLFTETTINMMKEIDIICG